MALLRVLPIVNNLDSTVRFEDASAVFERWPIFKSLLVRDRGPCLLLPSPPLPHSRRASQETLSQASAVPTDKLRDAVVSAFEGAPEAELPKLERLYPTLLGHCMQAFAGADGTYRLRVVSDKTSVSVSLLGLTLFPLLPSLEEIQSSIAERARLAKERSEEGAARQPRPAF
jgi:hypothetical protein